MAAEPYLITNPRENNVILSVVKRDSDGHDKTIALVRPGESYRADFERLVITFVQLPARLVISEDGEIRPDSRSGGPRLARKNEKPARNS